jgi:predicted nuclease of predicted toxin-antitoxin system
MKILIDEQLPTKLKYRFAESGYEVFTVRDMEWLGKKNGDLLKVMAANSFNVLLTNDKNLYYQQRVSALNFSIVNINTWTNRYDNILQILDLIKDTLKLVETDLQIKQYGKYYIVGE